MQFKINKEDGDRFIEEFLVGITQANGTKKCAEESYKILENQIDCELLLTIIIKEAIEIQSEIPKHIKDFEIGILSALTTIFCCAEKSNIPKPLQSYFEDAKNDDEIFDRVKDCKKLKYAVSNFVNAYMQFDYFESKYPEISKSL